MRHSFASNSFKKPVFVKKLKICIFLTIRFCSNFTNKWSKYVSNNVGRDLRLPMLVFATVAQKRFYAKRIAKVHFPIRHFMLPLLMRDIGNFKVSPYIIDKYLDHIHWWNLNKIVWSEIYKILSFLEVLTPF